MSQFFKALEQAERDRLRDEDDAGAATTPAQRRSTPRESPQPAPAPVVVEIVPPKPATLKPPAPEPAPVQTPPVSEPPVAAAPAARRASSDLAAAESVIADTPNPPVRPVSAGSTFGTSPANVFRPSLRRPKRTRLLQRFGKRPPVLIALTDPSSIEADAYRTVRANLELMANGHPSRHIAITSAAGGDGKSTTAANLAIVAAQAGRRVCLVDSDLRRPTVHEIFGLPNVDGLAAALEHGKSLAAVAKHTDIPNLSVVVAGRSADEAFHDVFTAQRLETILRQSEASFDVVFFDSPPITSVAGALSVAAVCDGVILVVRAGGIPFGVLRRAVAQVNQVKGRILGVLLNRVDVRTDESYRYYRAAYRPTRSDT
jgi:capsular exopolysaccharide synthesis family protein